MNAADYLPDLIVRRCCHGTGVQYDELRLVRGRKSSL
jgi:hypothetical protein